MPKCSRRPRSDLLALVVVALAGCAPPDERPLLETCRYARYWADCGGNEPDADPLLGCDRTSGECRWFLGGVTARGHEVSDCPPENMCCHGQSPFADWSPPPIGPSVDPEVGDITRTDVGLLTTEGFIGPAREGDLPVLTDHVGAVDRVQIVCTGAVSWIPCGPAVQYSTVSTSGDAIMVSIPGGRSALQIEIYPTEGADLRARVYYVYWRSAIDPDPEGWLCGIGWGGNIVPIDSGVLHVNAEGLTDPTRLHGLLEATMGAASFSIEF